MLMSELHIVSLIDDEFHYYYSDGDPGEGNDSKISNHCNGNKQNSNAI